MSKNNILKLCLAAFLLVLTGVSFHHWRGGDSASYVVVFHNSVDDSLIAKAGGRIEKRLHSAPAIVVRISDRGADLLRSNNEVLSVEINKKVKTAPVRIGGVSDSDITYRTESLTYTGKGVKVAVIDTGIGPHPSVAVSGGVSFVAGNPSYDDDNGHGTMVAGIIAAKSNEFMQGIAPDVALYAVKALDASGQGHMGAILSGVDWAIQNKMDVINLSFGSKDDDAVLRMLLQKAVQQGISVIVAAGNDGNKTGTGDTINYPAKYASVFSVGAIDRQYRRAPFSAAGPELFCADIGVSVRGPYVHGEFASMDGTSAAAPFVSGIVARALEAYPKAAHSAVSLFLSSNALDLGPPGRDPWYGYGVPKTDLDARVPVDAYGHWARSDIVFTTSKGWMNGVAPYVFSPNGILTRAQSAATLLRAMGISPSGTSAKFSDVPPSHWAYRYVNEARARGLVDGMRPGIFAPDSSVSREQMAELLRRALKLPPVSGSNPFSDMNPARWSYGAVLALVQAGVLDGFPDGTFRPEDPLTRGQIAAILHKCSAFFP